MTCDGQGAHVSHPKYSASAVKGVAPGITSRAEASVIFGALKMAQTYFCVWSSDDMAVLVPCLAATGGSGFALDKSRSGPLVARKKRRMQLIALNGLLALVPCAVYLYRKATAGQLDSWFYTIQAIELVFGAANLYLISLNMRDGLKLANRSSPKRLRRHEQREQAAPLASNGLQESTMGEWAVWGLRVERLQTIIIRRLNFAAWAGHHERTLRKDGEYIVCICSSTLRSE